MAVTVSSFSTTPNGFSAEQIEIFNDADAIFCETRPTMESVMGELGVDLEGKQIFSIYEKYDSLPDPRKNLEHLQYVLKNFDKKSIVIVSDDGLPHIVDPYTALIGQLVERGIHINITPNTSSLMSATLLADLKQEQFCFGGILVSWEDYKSKMTRLKEVSLMMPIVFFIVIPDQNDGKAMLDDVSEIFGEDREVMIMHSMGKPGARTYRCNAKDLWNRHQPHIPEPFTLVIYDPGY